MNLRTARHASEYQHEAIPWSLETAEAGASKVVSAHSSLTFADWCSLSHAICCPIEPEYLVCAGNGLAIVRVQDIGGSFMTPELQKRVPLALTIRPITDELHAHQMSGANKKIKEKALVHPSCQVPEPQRSLRRLATEWFAHADLTPRNGLQPGIWAVNSQINRKR